MDKDTVYTIFKFIASIGGMISVYLIFNKGRR